MFISYLYMIAFFLLKNQRMKPNIFQKIAFLVYISIIVLICVYFVPYQGIQNHLDFMMRHYKINSSYHSNILNDGYGTMSYFRFLIYLIVPTLSFYFVSKYLNGMNLLESSVYKKKAKRELYVFFLFASIIIGSALFFYVKNEYSEIQKEQLKSQISVINNSFQLLREKLSRRPPFVYELLKDNVDEYGIKIKKPWEQNYEVLENDSETRKNSFVPPSDGKVLKNEIPPLPKGFKRIKPTEKLDLDLSGYYKSLQKGVDNVLKEISNVRFSVIRKTQLEKNIKQLIYNESSSEDLNNMIVDYVKKFSEDGIKKANLELKLKQITFYNKDEIKKNIVFMFLASFILFYIIRPLFSMFKGMLKEVR